MYEDNTPTSQLLRVLTILVLYSFSFVLLFFEPIEHTSRDTVVHPTTVQEYKRCKILWKYQHVMQQQVVIIKNSSYISWTGKHDDFGACMYLLQIFIVTYTL